MHKANEYRVQVCPAFFSEENYAKHVLLKLLKTANYKCKRHNGKNRNESCTILWQERIKQNSFYILYALQTSKKPNHQKLVIIIHLLLSLIVSLLVMWYDAIFNLK